MVGLVGRDQTLFQHCSFIKNQIQGSTSSAPAKPTPSTAEVQIELDQNQSAAVNVGDIYVGVHQDEGFLLAEPERNAEEAAAASEALQWARSAPHASGAPLAHMSEICTLTTLDTPLTITPNLEYLCEFCNTRVHQDRSSGGRELLRCKCGHRRAPRGPMAAAAVAHMPSFLSSATSALAQQASLAASFFVSPGGPATGENRTFSNFVGIIKSLLVVARPVATTEPTPNSQYSSSPFVDKEFLHNKLDQSIAVVDGRGGAQSALRDVSAATLFDVAVLRCLHVPPWNEDGLFWAVSYFYHRLMEIRDYMQRTVALRQRSNSVPSAKQQPGSSGVPHTTPKATTAKLGNLTPASQREHLLSPMERSGSKRRRMAQASNSLDDAYKPPKFFLGGEKLRGADEVSPIHSPAVNHPRLQDVMFTFGEEEQRLLASNDSPTLSRTGLFPVTASNPVTPRERGMMRRNGEKGQV